jgi:hypothetical protein
MKDLVQAMNGEVKESCIGNPPGSLSHERSLGYRLSWENNALFDNNGSALKEWII